MVNVYSASNSIEANIVKGMLEANGIQTFIAGEFLQGGIGELAALDYIQVSVNNEDVEKAKKIIHNYETGQDTILV